MYVQRQVDTIYIYIYTHRREGTMQKMFLNKLMKKQVVYNTVKCQSKFRFLLNNYKNYKNCNNNINNSSITAFFTSFSTDSSDNNNNNNNDNNSDSISRSDFLSINTDIPSNIFNDLANVLFTGNDSILVKDILLKIIGNFNATRQNMCSATFTSFDRIDKKKDKNYASLASILTKFSPYNHPLVKSGVKNVDVVAQEFFDTFTIEPENNGSVSSEEWERYVMNQSLFIDNDASFELFLRRTWQMSGTFHLNKILFLPMSDLEHYQE